MDISTGYPILLMRLLREDGRVFLNHGCYAIARLVRLALGS